MKKLRLFFLMLITGGILAASTGSALAWNPFGDVCNQKGAENTSTCQPQAGGDPISGPNGVILKAVKVISIVTGIGAVIAIIVAGLQFITSSGDPQKVNTAKNTILYAVIGIIIVLLSQAIVWFIAGRL